MFNVDQMVLDAYWQQGQDLVDRKRYMIHMSQSVSESFVCANLVKSLCPIQVVARLVLKFGDSCMLYTCEDTKDYKEYVFVPNNKLNKRIVIRYNVLSERLSIYREWR